MRTANGTRAAWLISLGGTVALVAALGPVERRAAKSGESPAEKPTALDVIGELPRDETRLRVQAIVAAVQAAGFGEVYSIQYRHTLYEVKVRDAEGLRVELFVHPSIRKPLKNRGGELISKNLE
jgi:hypothetical protein